MFPFRFALPRTKVLYHPYALPFSHFIHPYMACNRKKPGFRTRFLLKRIIAFNGSDKNFLHQILNITRPNVINQKMINIFVVQVKPFRNFVANHELVNSLIPPIFYTYQLVDSQPHLFHTFYKYLFFITFFNSLFE